MHHWPDTCKERFWPTFGFACPAYTKQLFMLLLRCLKFARVSHYNQSKSNSKCTNKPVIQKHNYTHFYFIVSVSALIYIHCTCIFYPELKHYDTSDVFPYIHRCIKIIYKCIRKVPHGRNVSTKKTDPNLKCQISIRNRCLYHVSFQCPDWYSFDNCEKTIYLSAQDVFHPENEFINTFIMLNTLIKWLLQELRCQ